MAEQELLLSGSPGERHGRSLHVTRRYRDVAIDPESWPTPEDAATSSKPTSPSFLTRWRSVILVVLWYSASAFAATALQRCLRFLNDTAAASPEAVSCTIQRQAWMPSLVALVMQGICSTAAEFALLLWHVHHAQSAQDITDSQTLRTTMELVVSSGKGFAPMSLGATHTLATLCMNLATATSSIVCTHSVRVRGGDRDIWSKACPAVF